MDENARIAELAKARKQAAASRVELAKYTTAFGHLDDTAKDWMLETIGLTNPALPETDVVEAGKRFGELTYTWMGTDFVPWAQDLVGVPLPEQNGVEPEMEEEQLRQILGEFKEEITSSVGAQFDELKLSAEQTEKNARYSDLLTKARTLGYEPDSWQGKAFFQAAADETEGDFDVAHQLMIDRGIATGTETTEASGVTPAVPPVKPLLSAEPAQPLTEVPPTGGAVGGQGIVESGSDMPMTMDQAADATLELLTGMASST